MLSPVGAFLAPAPAAFSAAGRWAARPSTGLPHRGAPRRVPAAPVRSRRRPAVGAAAPPVATLAPLLPAAAPALAAAAPAALAAHLPPAATTAVTAAGDAVAAAAAAVAAPLALAFTDPWSISAAAADALAAQLFAASLFPYLAFLYFLSRPETGCPKGAYRGFAFLLVFVFATIPAGIYAKVVVGDILANVDWLHGSAESLLTVTNLLIVGGFRAGLASPTGPAAAAAATDGVLGAPPPPPASSTSVAAALSGAPPAVGNGATPPPGRAMASEALAAAVIAAGVAALAAAGGTSAHVEPANALSLPTWAIHVSSVAEWLLAMGLAWRYAAASGNDAWKGLVWGMVPLHASGVAACVFHAAYNAPAVGGLVALQAALTVGGNTCCAVAAWRVYRRGKALAAAAAGGVGGDDGAAVAPRPPLMAAAAAVEPPAVFWAKVVGGSVAAAAVVKWGELWLDGAFHPTLPVAVAAVVLPTAVNAASWAARGARETAAAAAESESVQA